MKLKFTILLLFVVFGIYAQKQLQPYNYSISAENSNETETIIIYASAEAVNSLTFTLKNAKNEVLQNKKDEDIIFKVFPFTETSFRKQLSDAIQNIKLTDKTKDFEVFKKRMENINNNEKNNVSANRQNTVLEIRNIFQFFNALVITAFEYDNEPIAGILKYKSKLIISKKQIHGLDTEMYFKKQAKSLRDYILDKEKKERKEAKKLEEAQDQEEAKEPENGKDRKKAKKLKQDYFFKYIVSDEIISEFIDFNINTRRKQGHKAKSKFKQYARKRLGELYNQYELKRLLDSTFFENYFNLKKEFHEIEKNISENERIILKNEAKINFESKYIDSTKTQKTALDLKLEPLIKNYDSEYKKLRVYLRELSQLRDALDKKSTAAEEEKIMAQIESLQENNLLPKENELNEIENNIYSLEQDINSKTKHIDSLKTIISKLKNKNDTLSKVILKEKNKLLKQQERIDNKISVNRKFIRKLPLWNFDVSSIEIDLNDGFIEHITVLGKVVSPRIEESSIREATFSYVENNILNSEKPSYISTLLNAFYQERIVREIFGDVLDKELMFVNEYPIGFSSKTDFADLSNYNLHSFRGYEKTFSVPLESVINLFVQRHQNDRLDFSPKDQIVRLPLDDLDQNNEIELKKEITSKILSANIFTDFNGLKESKPNGLVQVEVEKQIPLWTRRMDLGLGRSSNFGFINYANFNLTWAKLNEEDRELQVRYAENVANNNPNVDKYVTYLDLIKFENVSVGADLNIASFDFPLLKTRLELNAGVHYGRVKVVDTLKNTDGSPRTSLLEEDINMIRWYPDAILRIRPEERFGGYLRYRPFRTIVPNTDEDFFAVSSSIKFEEDRILSKSWMQRFEFGAFYTPSPDSDNKFFFRYRYTNNFEMETNGYSEIQLGYQIFLKF